MKRGFDSERGARFWMDGKKVNGSVAATITCYKPPRPHVPPTGPPDEAGSREKLALVIPSLREVRNLGPLLDRVRGVLATVAIDWEVIVVDDDSGDGTDKVVGAISQQDPRIRILVRRGERGLSGAILHGWRSTDATILGAMDADGQHPPEVLPRLIASLMEGHDLAIASRYAKGGTRGGNPMRRLASITAILTARPLQAFVPPVRDPLSGFFLVRRHSVENIFFQTAGFKILLKILVRGRARNADEVPIEFGKRNAGRSKLNVRVAWDYLLLLARLFREKYVLVGVAQQAHGD